jgi:hypothetical protein
LLLDVADIINVDVYHRSQKSSTNLHHFGVSTFVHDIEGRKTHMNDFIFSCFLNKLHENGMGKIWKQLLKFIDVFEFNVKCWLKNITAIIIDYSTTEYNSIVKTTTQYLMKHHDYEEDEAREFIKSKIQGCKFHFKQSISRVKKLLPKTQHKLLNEHINVIEKIPISML